MPPPTPAPRCASSSSSRTSSPTTTGASPASSGRDAGGAHVTEQATVVVGADGRYSSVAKAVEPEQYNERPPLEGNYYTYWSNLPVDGFDAFVRPYHGWAAFPTNDDLTLLVAGVAHALFDDYHHNVEATYFSLFDVGAGVRREAPWRDARGTLHRHGRSAELLPQALRPRLGARR